MNVAVSPRLLTGALPVEPRRRPTLRSALALGMPQLGPAGVSETWLLKECGDRHWRLLGELAGATGAGFRDETGAPVYAAFCAVSAERLMLDAFAEHDALEIQSSIERSSRTRFVSRHALSRHGAPAGEIELLSAFVRRTEPGRNRSIARVALDGFPEVEPAQPPGRALRLAAHLRADRWSAHMGFERDGARPLVRTTIRPCPSQDFNGAGLMYFASFQSLADRAEWELLDPPAAGVTTRARDIVYYGNVEPGERLSFSVMAARRTGTALDHWIRIEREAAPIADVFTSRGF